MIADAINKVTSTIFAVVDAVFTCIVNILAVPLSLAYTAASHTLSRKWQLSDISGVYYIWCSAKDRVIKCAAKDGVCCLYAVLAKYPRLFLLMFSVAAIPLIVIAIVVTLTRRNDSDESEIIEAEIVSEPEGNKVGRNENKKKLRK